MTKEMLAHSRATTLLAASAAGALAISLLAGASIASAGTWTSSGDDVYYTGGNVGIGTSTPWAQLSIQASTTDSYTLCNANPSGECLGGFYVQPDGSGSLFMGDGDGGTEWFEIKSNGSSIFNGGNVGIGITPTMPLHVGGNARVDGQIMLDTGSASAPSLHWGGAIGGTGIYAPGPNTIGLSTGGGERMRIASNGYVGINVTSPSYLLHLSTNSAGKPGGGSWSNSSDQRLKTNIAPMTNGLSSVLALNPVHFDWKNPAEHDGVTSTGGFIAQEVQEVFPDWVAERQCQGADCNLVNEDGDVLTLTLPFEFDAVVVGAIKDMWNMITGHNARIAKLEAEIAELKQLLSEQN